MKRRTVLKMGAMLPAFLAVPARASAGLFLVRAGTATAVIVLPEAADAQLTSAAKTLADYVEKSTGARLPITTGQAPAGQTSVRLGGPPPADVSGDGFAISPDADGLVIAGASSWGTRFGVYEFLERYAGVRWLFPGPDGEDVPARGDLAVPAERLSTTPAFSMRVFSDLGKGDGWDSADINLRWASRAARAHWPVEFHHKMAAIFPPKVYANPDLPGFHPDYYPLKDGKTVLPGANQTTGWQPRYSRKDVVDRAAEYVLTFFRDNPAATSISLGANDLNGYSEDELEPALNSFGYASASRAYYGFVNAVAERVAAEFPGKTIGLLAYTHVVDPPPFPLHPSVVPFLTRDRYIWANEEGREIDRRHTRAWRRVATRIGWYDYAYGTPYTLPRLDLDGMRQAWSWARANGVAFHYAELYPNWGEGPKAWIFARLTWDVRSDVRALLREWCERAVGPAGAADLVRYYELWDSFWSGRVPRTPFFALGRHRTYFSLNLADYLAEITPAEVARARRLLEAAAAKAQTPAQVKRAAILLRAFEYYEASALSYFRPVPVPRTDRQALALAEETLTTLDEKVRLARRRIQIVQEVKPDPILRHRLEPERLFLNWTGFDPYRFWTLADRVRGDGNRGALHDRLTTAAAGTGDQARLARLILRVASGAAPNRVVNGSFEDGTPAPWTISSTRAAIVRGTSFSGTASLALTGPQVDATQSVKIQPGLVAARFRYRSTGRSPAVAATRFIARDAAGATLRVYAQPLRFTAETTGRWAWLGVVEDVPAVIGAKSVDHVLLVVTIIDHDPARPAIHLDDVVLHDENS
ncbi:DUF4838 domain-containing protein [Nonomuraea sp. NPDC050547]|uniref:DUF4838 domain-containing protein n=1 Tax=Nonomuraea sp. NPDC050547 TaxID=3364368 RepID=UPI00378C7143